MSAGPPRGAPAGGGLCLVTGASGFIGGRLAERLSREGYAVRALVRAGSDTSKLEHLDLELVVGDLEDASSLEAAAAGCRHVLHCAALVSDWATRGEIARANVAGTRSLLAAAAGASVERFIQLSSTDVYGYPGTAAVAESNPENARFGNWYAHTKRLAEREVAGMQRAGRLATVILRPATVYGPGSVEVIGEIARAIKGGHMLLIDGGRPVAGLCYVENLLDAALLALEHEAAPGNAFNVTDGLPVTWRELTDDLARGLGARRVRWSIPYPIAITLGFALEQGYRLLRSSTGLSVAPLLSRQAVQVLGIDQDFSNLRLRRILGWEPRVDYAAGLQATLEWLTAQQR